LISRLSGKDKGKQENLVFCTTYRRR